MRIMPSALWILLLLAMACSPFTPQPRTPVTQDIGPRFSLYSAEAVPMDRWWESFSAPDLTALIDEALGGNFGLKESWARLSQAQARAVQAGAAIYPGLDAAAGATTGRQHSGSGGTSSLENASVGLISRYELDLWGRIRSEREAAVMEAAASREDVNAAAISLAAEVADRWVRLIAQRQQIALLERQLKINQTFLELIELRFQKAMVSALDVYQQKQVVERVRAGIPLARQQAQLLLNELAVLVGKSPQMNILVTSERLPIPADLPSAGVPADLLANRPDIRAAGKRLTAADWQVAAAQANRLPAINLTATARYGEADVGDLFNNWLLSLSASLTAPLLDGGRRKAEVDRTRARTEENLWAYRQVVITAIKEVEDALVSEAMQRAHITGLDAVSVSSRRALEEAVSRYRNGLSDYLPVLTQLLAVQDLERDLIRQTATLVQYRVSLYRALGGTWPSELTSSQSADPIAITGTL
ncbi:MAG: efflux transporter outer membrane subunit [Pseudomonadota bacterium]